MHHCPPLVGCAGGWLDYRYVGCTTGTCAVTSSPWLSTGFGCVLGSLLYTVLWGFLSATAMPLYRFFRRRLETGRFFPVTSALKS